MDSDMTFDPSRIKALTFDVGGSVFDWQTPVIAHVGQLAAHHSVELDAHEFAHRWRRRFFAVIAEIRAGKRTKMNADEIHRHLLDGVCEHYALPATDAEKDDLTWVWHAMDVWSDVPEALERLRTRYKVTILSVLSLSILVDSSKHAGISWDGMMSCEFLTHYKPEPESYRQGAALLACDVGETMMVAVHPGDLAAAATAGMRTGFVEPKMEEAGSAGDSSGFDVRASDYADFATQMGC